MIITIVLDNNTNFLAVCRNIKAGSAPDELFILEPGVITNEAASGVEVWLSGEPPPLNINGMAFRANNEAGRLCFYC
jgi:hypothetical protein